MCVCVRHVSIYESFLKKVNIPSLDDSCGGNEDVSQHICCYSRTNALSCITNTLMVVNECLLVGRVKTHSLKTSGSKHVPGVANGQTLLHISNPSVVVDGA